MSLPMGDERGLQSLSEGAIRKVNGALEPQRQSKSQAAPSGGAVGATDKQLPRDLRQEVTDRMAAALEGGTIPWERPWNEVKAGRPRNLLSDRDYQGGNRFMLMMVQIEKGYVDRALAPSARSTKRVEPSRKAKKDIRSNTGAINRSTIGGTYKFPTGESGRACWARIDRVW